MKVNNIQSADGIKRSITNHDFPKMEIKAANFFDLLRDKSVDGERFQRMGMKNSSQREYGRSNSFRQPSNRKSTSENNRVFSKREEMPVNIEKQQEPSMNVWMNNATVRNDEAGYIQNLEADAVRDSEYVDETKIVVNRENQELIFALLQSIAVSVQEIQSLELEGQLSDRLVEEISKLISFDAETIDVSNFEESDTASLKELEAGFKAILEEMQMQADPKHMTLKSAQQERLQALFESLNVYSLRKASTEISGTSEGVLSTFVSDAFAEGNLESNVQNELQHRKFNTSEVGLQSADYNLGKFQTDMEPAKSMESEITDFSAHISGRPLKNEWISWKSDNLGAMSRTSSVQEIYSQIKEGISKADLNVSLQEIVIKLKPEELGKVELRLELYKDLVIAKFDVESESVKEAIESNLKDLRSSLEQSGFSNMQFDVNVNSGREEHREQSGFYRTRTQSDIELNAEIQEQKARRSLNSIVEETQFEYLA